MRLWALGGAALLALAALSLLLPLPPGADPWAWVLWGREVLHADLHTTGGPSWKPLPVVATTVLAPLGGAAPAAWLVVARACALGALVLAARVAARLAGPAVPPAAAWAGGALAAAGLALAPAWANSVAQGYSEPVVVLLLLAAIDRHLAGRRG